MGVEILKSVKLCPWCSSFRTHTIKAFTLNIFLLKYVFFHLFSQIQIKVFYEYHNAHCALLNIYCMRICVPLCKVKLNKWLEFYYIFQWHAEV